jgi:endonuclease/exonuclease/phosphatase family metal-dependent hydrolase
MKVIFENITQGFVYAGKLEKSSVYHRFDPKAYVEYFKKEQPDILALAENIMEGLDGKSEMTEMLSKELDLPYFKSFCKEESFLYPGKYYGVTVLSKFQIEEYETFLLPNPKIEKTQPNGDHWVMHDKYAQKCVLNINGRKINFINLHYFPFHRFGRRMDEVEFADARKGLVDILTANSDLPTIITGDFNNECGDLKDAFPELFENDLFKKSIEVESTRVGKSGQFDHILITPKDFEVIEARVEENYSDHCAIITNLQIVINN